MTTARNNLEPIYRSAIEPLRRLMMQIHVGDKRSKPRLRVKPDGLCYLPFCMNSWLVFSNVQEAYEYLGLAKPANVEPLPVHNSHW